MVFLEKDQKILKQLVRQRLDDIDRHVAEYERKMHESEDQIQVLNSVKAAISQKCDKLF